MITTSIVASPGASMPAPFAMPPIVQPPWSTTAVLGTLSVVMIARLAASPPPTLSSAAATAAPMVSFARSSCSPISPVEQTSTSPAESFSASATASAVAWAVWKPWLPVKQLAPPEFSTIARTWPSVITCWDQRIGLAFARLLVNTAAAAALGPWLTTRARSGEPELFSPACTPAARKPAAAVTVTERLHSR